MVKIDFRNDTQMANILGAVFLAVMVLAFVPNPLVGPEGFFVTNAAHDLVHGLVGLALLVGAKMRYGKVTIIGAGIFYLIVAILGYASDSHMLFGMVMVNMADHYLHIVLSAAMLFLGAYVRPSRL
ncbi:MAG: DUF4383 domain-containing protein [Alphaproteobacteria bacterium]